MADTNLYKTLTGLLAVETSLWNNEINLSSAISSAYPAGKIVVGNTTGLTSSNYSFRADTPVYGSTFGNSSYITTEDAVTGYVNYYVNGVGNVILDYVHKHAYTSGAAEGAIVVESIPADAATLANDSNKTRTLKVSLNANSEQFSQENDQLDLVSGGVWKLISSAVESVEPDVPEYSISAKTTANTGYAKTYDFTKDGAVIGSIDIPKDQFLLTSCFAWSDVDPATAGADIKLNPATKPAGAYNPYLFLELAPSGSAAPVSTWIPLDDLVDVYDGSNGVAVNGNHISGVVKPNDPYLKVGADGFYTDGIDSTISNVSGKLADDIEYVSGVVDDVVTALGDAGKAASSGKVFVGDASGNIDASAYGIGDETYANLAAFGSSNTLATEHAVSSFVTSALQTVKVEVEDDLTAETASTYGRATTIATEANTKLFVEAGLSGLQEKLDDLIEAISNGTRYVEA